MHRVAVPVERIEPRVGVPGFIEVNPVDARIEERLDAPRVVAEPVVGGVGHDGIDRSGVAVFRHERVRLDRSLDGLLLEPVGRDGSDDPVAVSQRHEVARDGSRHDEAVFDRLVAVPVAQGDLIPGDGRHEDDPVRHGRAVGDAVRAMRAEHPRRIPLVLAHGSRVVEQRPEAADADRQVGAKQVLAEVVEEDPADRRFEERGAAVVARCVPRVLVLLGELHHCARQRWHHHFEIPPHGRDDASPDERSGILQGPDELVDILHHLDGDGRCLIALRHQEDRDLLVARAHQVEQPSGARVVLVATHRPVHEDGMDGRVGDDHGGTILR